MRTIVLVLALTFVAAAAARTHTHKHVRAPPNKPVWPTEFDAPFQLFDLTVPTPIVNQTSHFYYNFDQYEAQRISYPQQCVPLLTNGSFHPCDLYFNANGTYMSAPALGAKYECCLVLPGVGPIPPQFLNGFNWDSVQSAPDAYGESHVCNYWTGSGFGYWTDITTNHDIFFNDGGSGAYWAWGHFHVAPQPQSLFELPGTLEQCSQSCFFDLSEEEMMSRLDKVSALRLALEMQSQRRGL